MHEAAAVVIVPPWTDIEQPAAVPSDLASSGSASSPGTSVW